MRKKIIILIILIIVFSVVFLFRNDLLDLFSKISLKLPRIEEGINNFITNEIEKKILTPPPLRYQKEVAESYLTQQGVIQWTNTQRKNYGLPALKENLKLDLSAEMKTQDMFENQYFSHESSSGVGVADLAKTVNYDFIAIGENLALGNFKNDEELVQAWIDSPGHRENILNNRYQEIGVAVKKGNFEGKTVWMAVQHFGLSTAACPKPEEAIKLKIEENQKELAELQSTLNTLQSGLQVMRPKRGSAYNQKVGKYNDLVEKYNALLEETKILIQQYNNQIKLFNTCAAGT